MEEEIVTMDQIIYRKSSFLYSIFVTAAFVSYERCSIASEIQQNVGASLRPLINDASISLRYYGDSCGIETNVHVSGDYFAGIYKNVPLYQFMKVGLGVGLGDLSKRKISEDSEINNPIFPIGLNVPSYSYKLSRRFVGAGLYLRSSFALADNFMLDVDWINIALPIGFYGKEDTYGDAPRGTRVSKRVSSFGVLFGASMNIN
jgi:hypothetical protein